MESKLLSAVKSGAHVLLTGGAGVGKSYNIRQLIKYFDRKKVNYAVAAMTGAASLQLPHGRTIHSLLALGIARDVLDAPRILQNYRWYRNEKFQQSMLMLDVLIIDEVSMMRSDFFELLENVLRNGRAQCELLTHHFLERITGKKRSEIRELLARPFGGVQIILSGDFMQLAPVVKNNEFNKFVGGREWVFNSQLWNELNLKIVYLTDVKRQNDKNFAYNLNMVRCGAVPAKVMDFFAASMLHDVENPVVLASTNNEVDNINANALNALNGELSTVHAKIKGDDEKAVAQIKKDVLAPEILELKPGCQIMLLMNDVNGRFVNGSLGEFLGYVDDDDNETNDENKIDAMSVRINATGERVDLSRHAWSIEERKIDEETGEPFYDVLASFEQFPVKLAYAITIHKSQGMTIDKLRVDLSRCFANGMAYVALSRAKSYENLQVLGFSRNVVKTDPNAFNFYMNLKREGKI